MMRALYMFGIWLVYVTNMRKHWNTFMRWKKGERNAPELPLKDVYTVRELLDHLKPFQYRLDKGDYVSKPTVFEHRLASETRRDGDCDDIAHYQATQLKRLFTVQDSVVVSVGYTTTKLVSWLPFKKTKGHMACAFLLDSGQWNLMNYQEVIALSDLKDAERALLEWAERKYGAVESRWFYAETTEFKRVKL